jgi:hypothetical protein
LLAYRGDRLRQAVAQVVILEAFQDTPQKLATRALKLLRTLFGPPSPALPEALLLFDLRQSIAADSPAVTATLARMLPKITVFRIAALIGKETSRATIESVIENQQYNEDDLGSLLVAAWDKTNVVNLMLDQSRATCPQIEARHLELCFMRRISSI